MDWVTIKLARVADAVVNRSLGIKPGEQVAVAADHDSDEAIVKSLLAAVTAAGAEPTLIVMPRRALSGAPGTPVMAKALLGADAIIAPTSTGLGFTPEFGQALRDQGARAIVMTGTDRDLLLNGAGAADYDEVRRITAPLAAIMSEGRRITVESDAGSEFSASIEGQPAGCGASFAREPGEVSSFPSGESWQCPAPGTGEGVLVADGSAHMLGRLTEPLAVEFREGLAVDYRGGEQAEQLRAIIEPIENGDNLGELSIGTNPAARFTGNVTEDKKRVGTSHFALGNSVVGGPVKADIHLDLLMMKPTIEVDGTRIVERGEIVYTG